MPHVSVYVDVDDVLDELSDEELREEIRRRNTKRGGSNSLADYSIPQKVAKFTLEEAADLLRKQGRVDLAYKLEEIKTDFVGY